MSFIYILNIDELLIKLGNSKSDMKRNESVESFTQIAYPDSLDGSDSNGNPTPIQLPSATSSPKSQTSQHSKIQIRILTIVQAHQMTGKFH